MTVTGMSFSFNYTTQENCYETLQNLDKKKKCQKKDIPVEVLKSHNDLLSYFIHHNDSLLVQFFS